MELGYEETETVTVTLADPSPARGPVSGTNSATTEPAPPPTVVASRGAACNDDPATGLPPCDTGLFGGRKCTDASCAFVHIVLSNWRTDVPGTAVYCSVNSEPGRPYDPNANTDTPDYYGSARWHRHRLLRERPRSDRHHPVHLVTPRPPSPNATPQEKSPT